MGRLPLPEELRTKQELNLPIKRYPLGLAACSTCHHIQLTRKVEPETIYRRNYFYDYSITRTGRNHWQKLVAETTKRYSLRSKDLVIDIGSNTGLLLSLFKGHSQILGIDPNPLATDRAIKNGIPTVVDFFNYQTAQNISKLYGPSRIITCTNTFDHVDNLSSFLRGLERILAPDGVAIIEVPYVWNMVTNLTHIPYHQQIDYFALTPLVSFCQKFGLEIFDAEEIDMHGGSLRLFLSHPNVARVTPAIHKLLEKEKILYTNFRSRLGQFKQNIETVKRNLTILVKRLKREGKRLAAVGASAKGITLLNYCGLDHEAIDFITEKSPLKIGRFTPTNIPIVSDETLFEVAPDYALLLAWNFQKEVIANLKGYKGTWIIPVPKLTHIP